MNGSDAKVTPPKSDVIGEETMESAPFILKAIVVGLGIAIIGMLGLILYKIVAGPSEEAAPTPIVEAVLPPAGISAKDFDIAVPAGATLVSVQPHGAEVFLHVRLSDGSDKVIVVNRANGEISRLTLQAANN